MLVSMHFIFEKSEMVWNSCFGLTQQNYIPNKQKKQNQNRRTTTGRKKKEKNLNKTKGDSL